MSKEKKILERGKIEIENSYIKCFLGKENNFKSSEDIWKEIKDNDVLKIENSYKIDDEKYKILYPIPQKNISIILKNGKKCKSNIYFIDDIEHIISGLNMENACYLHERKYIPLKKESAKAMFLFDRNTNEIKDIGNETIDLKELKDRYEEFKFQETLRLIDINKNINIYSKIDNIGEQDYFLAQQRTWLSLELDSFNEIKERKDISDVMFGILGNYASGKSFFLIYYNYTSITPSIYLNVKSLKDASGTKGFSDLLNNEIIILFKKLKLSFENFKSFISKFLPYENKRLDDLLLSIIEEIKNKQSNIIIDQYQEGIFGSNNFIVKLKEILLDEDSNIKVIISSSINNKKSYLNQILEKTTFQDNNEKIDREDNYNKNSKKKTINDYIPYHFMPRLVNDCEIKTLIKKKNLTDNKIVDDILKLFNYLPLYYNLCEQKKDCLDIFIKETKDGIEKKIYKFNNKEINVQTLDQIRKMIGNEITISEINLYGEYIPFKYFNIENIDNKYYLRSHFPLINEIWEDIIMKETAELFDGEIKYDGNIIGSFLELNFINHIKSKKIGLDIDAFVKVDSIYNFEKIIEGDNDKFNNKNILITQKNEDAPYFDLAYLYRKDSGDSKLIYIQVKKSCTNNRINNIQMNDIFEEKKKNILNLFNIIPKEAYLVYITLINDKIKKTIIENSKVKNGLHKKVSDLGKDSNSLVYSINELNKFCTAYNIPLYYYEPKTQFFYIYKNNNFIKSDLNLMITNNNIDFDFSYSFILSELDKSKLKCAEINSQYSDYLQKKRKKAFKYEINGFDMGIVFEFAKNYFNNIKIINYVDLHKTHLDCQFKNFTKSNAIICLKLTDQDKYDINAVILTDCMIKIKNDEFLVSKEIIFERDNDYLVAISFESIGDSLKSIIKNNK